MSMGMTRWQRVRWWLRGKPRTKEEALADIRRHYREMGIPVDHLSDEELERNIVAVGRVMAKMGMGVKEATENMVRAFQAFDKAMRR